MKTNEQKLKSVILENYDLLVKSLTPLSGFYDENYKIKTNNDTYFLKIYKFDKLPSIVFQLDFIDKCDKKGLPVAPIIHTTKGKLFSKIEKKYSTLQKFLPGTQLRKTKINLQVIGELGKILGKMHRLTNKNNFKGKTWKKYPWDLAQFDLVIKDYTKIKKQLPPNIAKIIESIFAEWNIGKIKLNKMKKGVVHNDFHGGNILVKNNKCTGIVDFGDSIYTWHSADIAIAIAHICPIEKDFQNSMAAFLKGYKTKFKLSKLEEKNLPLLIKMRAATIIIETLLLLKDDRHEIFNKNIASQIKLIEYFKTKTIDRTPFKLLNLIK